MTDTLERFHAKVDITDGCWLWTGAIDRGYGRFRDADGRVVYAHRWLYVRSVGPVLDGLTLDHLCRVRRCVRPDHLEPVTRGANVLRGEGPSARNARKTHCPQRHPYDEANTYRTSTGRRQCRVCRTTRNRMKKGVI